MFEFYSRADRKMMVFTLDSDKACFDGDWPYSHRHFPFVHPTTCTPCRLLGVVTCSRWLDCIPRTRRWTRIIDSTYRSGRKYLAMKGALDEESVSALESEDDDIVVFVDGPAGENPANLIQPLMRQPISGEVLNTQGQLVGLLDQVIAFNDFDSVVSARPYVRYCSCSRYGCV